MSTWYCIRLAMFALAFLSFLALPIAAQIGGSGTIKGTVTDPSGAVVPGATVTAAHTATGVETQRTTTDAGLFVIAPLQVGTYTVTAAASEFRPLVQEQIVVDALASVDLSLTLEVGAITESVTVNSVDSANVAVC